MRPMDNPDLPLLFWWEGPDGSRVLSLRILENYSAPARMLPSVANKVFAPGFTHGAFFLGVGNHGGGVTREQVRQMIEFQKDPALPEIRWSTLRDFFKAVEQSPAFPNLPVVRHDLQHVARGCYSSHAEVKSLNRRAEQTLGHAEAIAAVACRTAGYDYPTVAFHDAWWKVAFNQFHDMLAGTALPSVYAEVRDGVGAACDTATASRVESLLTMAKRVDTSAVEETAIFLFNPLPWKRTALLEMQAETPSPVQDGEGSRPELPTLLRGHDGTEVPIQWVNDLMPRMWIATLVAQVELPPCGYRVLELAHGRPPAPLPWLDNCKPCADRLGIASLLAPDGQELLAEPISLVVIEDRSNAFGHGASVEREFYLKQFRREAGRPTFVSSKVVEDGPVLRITRQRARWKTSDIVLDIIQFRGHEEIELRLSVDWHERGEMLKLEVPTAFAAPVVHAKTAASVTKRDPDGEEHPYQDWVAVGGRLEGQDYTVGLLNTSTYSYDCLGGLLRTVVLRSVPFVNRFSVPGPLSTRVPDEPPVTWMDQGRQERAFRLVPARGRWNDVALDRRAQGFQSPAEYVADSRHAGAEPWERSYLEIGPAGVSVLAVKRAEDGSGTIVRIQECAGVPTEATVKSAAFGIDARLPLRPFQLKTLLLADTNELREVTLLEQPHGG
jgi:alpha-mannosidase